jgi:hypothetical protein
VGEIVHEVDDAGAVIAALSYASDARRQAFSEAVRRAYARLRFPETIPRMTRAVINGDLATAAACLSESCTVEDHRYLRAPEEQDASPYVLGLLGSTAAMAPDHVLEVLRIEAPGPRGHLAVIRLTGTTEDGAQFESPYISVACWDSSGLISSIAIYELEDIELARSQLAERTTTTAATDPLAIPRNLAVRRAGRAEWTLIAALGDHLCLHDTGTRLALHEVDDDGEVIAYLVFDRTARRSAADEIRRRCYSRYDVPQPASEMATALNAHDFAALRACMADSCVFEDHRGLNVSEMREPDEWIAGLVSMIDFVPDFYGEVLRIDALEPWGNVALTRLAGANTEGGLIESEHLACSVWDEAGRVTLIAMYDPNDVDAAVERLAAEAR